MMTKQKGFVVTLLMTTAFTPLQADASCTPTPDCTELGYTQTLDECPDNAVKCPWDTSKVHCCGSSKCSESFKYTCTGVNEVAIGDYCGNKYTKCSCANGYKWENGSCKHCEIGDIFYSDYNCTSAANYDSKKEVLGIVVHINADGVGGQVMTPWPIDKDGSKSESNVSVEWSTEYVDIAGLPNYDNEAASKDYNSCGHTDAIVKQGDASKYPAAWATRKYTPNEATKGKWCLPAAGIMTNIYNDQDVIQAAIKKVGGVTIPVFFTWSSSRCSTDCVWYSSLDPKYTLCGLGKSNATMNTSYYVRPVLEF